MKYPWLFLLVLVSALLAISDACGRKPATSPQTESPIVQTTAEPNITGVDHHKQECLPHEVRKAGCLNGGTCFVVDINGVRIPACNCPKLFTGDKCHEISPDIYFPVHPGQEEIATAGIAASVVFVIIFLVVIICCVVVHIRRKRKKRRGETSITNGSLIQHETNGTSNHATFNPVQEKVPMADWLECELPNQMETDI